MNRKSQCPRIFNSITNKIRSSCLNYSIQETPFSLYFTVRKSTIKSSQFSSSRSNISFEEPEQDDQDLKTKHDGLEKENNALKNRLEEAFIKNEKQSKHIDVLEQKVQTLQVKIATAETETRVDKEEAIAAATKSLQVKHEKICADLKITKTDNQNLRKELDIKSVAIQTDTRAA